MIIDQIDEAVLGRVSVDDVLYQKPIIPAEELNALGYKDLLGHHLCSVAHAPDDNAGEGLHSTGQYLVSAACLNLYPRLMQIGAERGSALVTSRALVFRREAHYDDWRHLCFEVREFLTIGSESTVRQNLTDVEDAVLNALRAEDGLLSFEAAEDSFMPSRFQKMMGQLQAKNAAKKELVGDKIPVALGSSNYHGRHFVEVLRPDLPNLVTGCLGVGLTRVSQAVKLGHCHVIAP